jgi:hypothetical protein
MNHTYTEEYYDEIMDAQTVAEINAIRVKINAIQAEIVYLIVENAKTKAEINEKVYQCLFGKLKET